MKFTLFFVAIFAAFLFVTSSPVEGDKLAPSIDGSYRISTFNDDISSTTETGVYMPTTSRGLKGRLERLIRRIKRCLRVIKKAKKGKTPTKKECKVGLKKCKLLRKICRAVGFLLRKKCKKAKKVCRKIKNLCD